MSRAERDVLWESEKDINGHWKAKDMDRNLRTRADGNMRRGDKIFRRKKSKREWRSLDHWI